jgi:SpoVK/Ycf46/Vps4 family AAA+-type ATPase
MDKKDEIILQQLDVIRSMTERNLRSVNSDFWGTPLSPAEKLGEKAAPKTPDKTPGRAPEKKSGGPEQPSEAPESLPKEDMKDLLAELDGYIGLQTVKEEVHNLINMASVYQLRRQHDLPTTDMSLHLVFTGNPGTGKTMMARMMARIYRSLDILSRGQLVEVDRSGLVAGYVGQTAIKTQKVIEKAMGGVLFIDEAYALNGRSENDFGQEAIDTILKAMEDHRDDLVVIVAGYTDLMDRFIHSNPGLESRFNRFLLFDDYTTDEMVEIFRMQCKKGCYQLTEEAQPLIRDYIAEESADDSFGNARGVRNLFEHVLVAQNNRLATMEKITREDLMTITADDVLRARGKVD